MVRLPIMAHIHEHIDWTAGAYIVYKNKVLIRKHDKYGIWTHVGGHIELDEDPVSAVIRECKEEVGLDVTIYSTPSKQPTPPLNMRHLIVPAHMNIHYVDMENSQHQHIDLIYYATSDTDLVIPENNSDEWVWLTKAEVRDHSEIDGLVQYYALEALHTLVN